LLDEQKREALDGLVRRLADGDRTAIRPCFELLWPVVRNYCRRLLAGHEDANDAAQQALEKVFSQASSYDPSRPALPWVLAIATWECRTMRKRWSRSREIGTEFDSAVRDGGASPEERLIHVEQECALREAMSELTPADQTTLQNVLDEVEPASRTVGGATFRKRHERAVTRLRNLWRELYG
jgi:RNA polymerase sigma-70 factor (ECF subfamily)